MERLISWEFAGKIYTELCPFSYESDLEATIQLTSSDSFFVGQIIGISDIPDFEKLSAVNYIQSNSINATIVKIVDHQITVALQSTSTHQLEEINQLKAFIPLSNEFLHDYNENKATKLLQNSEKCTLITNIGGVSLSYHGRFEYRNESRIFLKIDSNHIITNHLRYTNQGILQFQNKDVNSYFRVYLDIKNDQATYIVECIPQSFSYDKQTRLDTYYYKSEPHPIQQVVEQSIKGLKYWFKAIRGVYTLIAILPVLTILGIVSRQSEIKNPYVTILILIGILCFQIAASFLNDYFDHLSQVDEFAFSKNTILGSSKFIQNGLITPRKVLSITFYLLPIGVILGLYLNLIAKGNVVLLMGIIGVLLSYFYSAKPLKLSYRGGGEVVLAFLYGPLLMIGTYWVLTNSLPTISFADPVFGAMSLVTCLLIIINLQVSMQDMEIDKLGNKKTTAVLLGSKGIRIVIGFIFHILYIVLLYKMIADKFTFLGIVTLFTYPISLWYQRSLEANQMDEKTSMQEISLLVIYFIWMILLTFTF